MSSGSFVLFLRLASRLSPLRQPYIPPTQRKGSAVILQFHGSWYSEQLVSAITGALGYPPVVPAGGGFGGRQSAGKLGGDLRNFASPLPRSPSGLAFPAGAQVDTRAREQRGGAGSKMYPGASPVLASQIPFARQEPDETIRRTVKHKRASAYRP